MVKSYLRYTPDAVMGLVAVSPSPLSLTYSSGPSSRTAVTAALEEILVWDIRRGMQEGKLALPNMHEEVTCVVLAADGSALFAGYANGSVRVWDPTSHEVLVTFTGHKSATTCLAQGTGHDGSALLASGSKDTDIIMWDIVGEEGLYRLRGHKDMVTAVAFVESSARLVSASKDTLVKVWDLTTQACVQTVVGHRAHVWSLAFSPDLSRMVTGSVDACFRVWDTQALAQEGHDITYMGRVDRTGKDRVADIQFGYNGALVLVTSGDASVEIFRVRDAAAVKKKITRRMRRKREKSNKALRAKAASAVEDAVLMGYSASSATTQDQEEKSAAGASQPTTDDPEVKLFGDRPEDAPRGTDEFAPLLTIRVSGRVRAAAFPPHDPESQAKVGPGALPSSFLILVSLASNALEEYRVDLEFDDRGAVTTASYTRTGSVTRQGHGSDIRALALSRNDDMFASGSNESIKVWSTTTGECIRDLSATSVLSLAFVPGDRFLLAGTKDGAIIIFDLRSASIIETVQAHDGAVWAIKIHPSGERLVTASADAELRMWDFEVVGPGGILGIVHSRTLKMTDDILALSYSTDGSVLAVSLLDTTVKIFFEDSLKFMLSLYGHKLPVLALDFSSDGELIVTGSADKNIKVWGAVFGDCHKSIFAHADSVMSVIFVPHTHYVFSAGKDGLIKYWDMDTFEVIQILRGHHSEIWSMALSRLGDLLITGSHDKSLRVWRRTEEQLFIEEEREAEAELELAHDLAVDAFRDDPKATADATDPYVGKATITSIKDGERLLEAIDLAVAEDVHFNPQVANDQPSPMLMGLSPSRYLARTLARIPTAHLEEALMVLPFSAVMHLLHYLELWISAGIGLELCSRSLFFLLSTHHHQIAANSSLLLLVRRLRSALHAQLTAVRDKIGFNLAALNYVETLRKEKRTVSFAPVGPDDDDDDGTTNNL